ncbi:TonB-dependent receptor [Seonamhaeicola sp.]|uniref:SusC/RagA family TonB-linked outer membrane protein n=1 Tax=Seonamhaeicola sp. TaxID=1912245 RepID=UPI00260644C0|nr:TonB-dependent receptor [Seonamhaeicola sp.]
MRTFIFLCCTMIFAFSPVDVVSQNSKIKVEEDKILTVDEVFDLIMDQTDYKFFYEEGIFDDLPKIRLKKGVISTGKLLKRSLLKGNVELILTENNAILIKEKIEKSIKEKPQEFEVSGVVTDQNGQPLPGANVIEKGTTNGTQTDFDGKFQLSISGKETTLVVSYIGFLTKEIQVNEQANINIALVEDAAKLDEVVVVGYGTQRKSDLTGSVTAVSEKVLQSRPVPSFQDAIQGRASGVNIRQSGGDLDGKFDISIRGIGSVTGSNAPLIVVDGVPLFSADFSTINPKDIASINILKDASATAIYGSRASNGVVIISTKRGKSGKAKFRFSSDIGFENPINRYDVLSTEEQRQLFVEAFTNSNRNTAVYDDPSNPIWQIDTDWQDLGTRTAFRQAYNLGVTGGNDKNQYAFSASLLDREGTILNTGLKSWNLRANIDSRINDKLKVSGNIAGSHQKSDFMTNDQYFGQGYRRLIIRHSYTEPFDEDGNLTAVNTTAPPYFGGNNNPLIEILLPTRERTTTRLIGSIKADYNLTQQLLLSANIGGDVVNGDTYEYLPVYSIGRYQRAQGDLTQTSSKEVNWLGEATLQYENTFDAHDLKALVGVSAQEFNASVFRANGTGTVNNRLNQLSNQTNFTSSGSDITSGLVSYFFRVNYGYDGKYLFTGTVRRDGSSRFGASNRYGTFPSASVAWKISEEKFMENSFFNSLKLRASYGLTGNQNIGDFAFITRAGEAGYAFGNSAALGNAAVNIGNENLKWETSKQFDLGVNASFFNGRLNVEMDYYDKRSEDLLIAQPTPLTVGVGERPIVNIGSVKNSGFEFSFNSTNIQSNDLSWTTDFNITYNKNEVLDIGLTSQGNPLELEGSPIPLANERINLTQAGYPVGAFNTYIFDGIWQLGQEAEAAAWSGAVPGDVRYADLNGNGTFDQGDRAYTGTNPHPKFFGGMNNTISYKNLSASIFVNFATGYQVFHSARHLLSRAVPFPQNLADVRGWWTPDNPSNTVPRPSQGGNTTFLASRPSTRFLEDGDFFRIKNISLSYELPKETVKKLNMEGIRFTLTGTNLFTFTKYTGLDPEASSISGSGSLLSVGIDHTPYPITKLYSMTLEFNF